jgi:hypothetical protein
MGRPRSGPYFFVRNKSKKNTNRSKRERICTCNIKLSGHAKHHRCGLQVTSDKHHLPRTCHDKRGQTRTKLTDTIRAIKRITRDLSVNKLFIYNLSIKTPEDLPKLPPRSAPARRRCLASTTHPTSRATPNLRAITPPTASPRRSLGLIPTPGL